MPSDPLTNLIHLLARQAVRDLTAQRLADQRVAGERPNQPVAPPADKAA